MEHFSARQLASAFKLLGSVLLLTLPMACGSENEDSAGVGGSTPGSGGSTGGASGSTGGASGSTGGSSGSTGGSSGSTGGSSGSTGGASGSTGGASGSSGGASGSGGSEVTPPLVDPNGPRQFLTWDGGSGPSSTQWNRHLRLPWKTTGSGDWLDAEQTPQGTVPYVSASVTEVGPVSLDVTSLVQRWLDNGENRGFYLRTDQAFAFHFVGRTASDVANRPSLEVVTDQGSFAAPPLANAQWSPTSTKAVDSRSAFKVNSGQTLAIVLFDLEGVKGKVQSATLRLTCTELKYKGVLNIFEADPPVFRVGGGAEPPIEGIAAAYPLDKGIENHPSVLFAADFSDIKGKYSGSCGEAEQQYDSSTESTYIRGKFIPGKTGSCGLKTQILRGTAEGVPERVENALYARYYVYLESDWGSTVDGNKMPGWDNRFGWWNPAQGGYWQSTTGNGGSPGTGLKVWNKSKNRWEYEGHSLRGLGGTKAGDGNYYDDLFWVGGYIYNLDQGGAFGNDVGWTGTVLSKERWFCIEQYIRMNSVEGPYDAVGNGTAVKDGVYRAWVDGVLSVERTDLRWTRRPEYGLEAFWFNWYHGGTQPPITEMHYRMNSVVVAKEYIGPRKDP
ncbi:MAG TPA: hypothetical protein PLJ27_09025 [Polyangiaceae bacterium]|nr:hypothetical protein [Polyangiaceae bacterium]